MTELPERAQCPVCGYSVRVQTGRLVEHSRRSIPGVTPAVRCAGSGMPIGDGHG